MHITILTFALAALTHALPQATTTTSPRPSASTTTSAAATVKPTQSSSVQPPASTSPSTPGPTDAAYVNTILRHHNVHRANHSVSALKWSQGLADIAKGQAEVCVFAHNVTGPYGQNIGAGYGPQSMGSFITGMYNGEVQLYNSYGGEPSTSNGIPWGHFTQIVWQRTTTVGCYTADCSSRPGNLQGFRYFTVCNYGPAGNVIGSFATNVLRSKGQPSVGQSYGCTGQANPNLNCV